MYTRKVESEERNCWDERVCEQASLIVSLLNEYRVAWALIRIRQWAGHDAAVAQREAEIQRPARLVWDAVYALQKAGLDSKATSLRRAIEKAAQPLVSKEVDHKTPTS